MQLPHSFISLLCAVLSTASIINTTVDDSDSSFSFVGTWNTITPTSPCSICSSQPASSQTFDGTWHDGNIRNGAPVGTSGSFTFQGSAVYIFGIDQAQIQPDIAFTLGNVQSVHHYTGTETYAYNALFFSASGLAADQTHTVTWEFDLANTSVVVQVALFDYAIVTSEEEDAAVPATSSTTTMVSKPPPTMTSEPATSLVHQTTSSTTSLKITSSQTAHSSSPNLAPSSIICLRCTPEAPSFTNGTSGTTATITQDSLTTVTTTPEAQSSHAKPKTNLAAIIGATLGVLATAVGLLVYLFFRSRKRHRLVPQTDEVAHARFLRFEDHPGLLHSMHQISDSGDIDAVLLSGSSNRPLLPRPERLSDSHTAPEPHSPATSTETLQSSPAPFITSSHRNSGVVRALEERLATLEAQIQPPPYMHED